MIKFFRKIRQNMIKDLPAGEAGNRTSKYLLYAIGEIFDKNADFETTLIIKRTNTFLNL